MVTRPRAILNGGLTKTILAQAFPRAIRPYKFRTLPPAPETVRRKMPMDTKTTELATKAKMPVKVEAWRNNVAAPSRVEAWRNNVAAHVKVEACNGEQGARLLFSRLLGP